MTMTISLRRRQSDDNKKFGTIPSRSGSDTVESCPPLEEFLEFVSADYHYIILEVVLEVFQLEEIDAGEEE